MFSTVGSKSWTCEDWVDTSGYPATTSPDIELTTGHSSSRTTAMLPQISRIEFTEEFRDWSNGYISQIAFPVDLADSPGSTSIDQDAPSSSTPSTQEQEQSLNISQVDPILFTWKARNDLLWVQIYVDDILFASTNTAMCNEFANQMTTKFKMSMMGQMSFFLGLQISQSPRGIFINQSKYASEIVKKYGLLTTDSIDIPMVEKNKLDEDLQGKQVDATLYRGMIGSFMYLTSSRPDLIYAVCLCAHYQAKPTEKHLQAVKQIFRYLKGTINIGLWYSKDTDMSLTAYAD
ncbi:uncharacterized mitochondrial protein-like protein [Tanacetum coccineum]